jgi:hypothetical protein
MDNSTTMYIVLGLLTIFFIVLIIFSAKTWRWLHVTSAVFVFIGALFFVWLSAATLQTHANWRGAVNKLNDELFKLQKQHDDLLAGDLHRVEQVEDNIRDVKAALSRVTADRPPMWQNCVPQVTGDSVTLTIGGAAAAPPEGEPPAEPPAGDPAPPAAAAAKHTIEPNNIIFAFLEGPSELSGKLEGITVPKTYLGEFRVVGRTDTTITVEPTMRLTPQQQAMLADGNWTIYDNMPVDAHYAFAGLSADDLKKLFPKERMTVTDAQYTARIGQLARFFEGKTPAQVAALIPKASLIMDDAKYEEFINRYVNDRKAADENAPPERVWKRVTFLKPHSMVVDAGGAAAPDEGAALSAFEGKNFDATGRAMNQLLKQGTPTDFEPGDEAVFDPPTAEKLVNAGLVKIKENVYVRPLRDYKSFFDDSFRQEIKFEDSAAVLKADSLTLAEAAKQSEAQLTYRADELAKLKQDRDGFLKELAAVEAVLARLEAFKKDKLATNSELYRGNLIYADKIRQEQLRQAAEIYRRGSAGGEGESLPAPSTPAPTSGAVSSP